ncbi:MAG: hypothetical protein HY308_10185 [Gammaproteobacteria bacterium]|nr:hypothetical protein [Gammaproteobacteria bacterium]
MARAESIDVAVSRFENVVFQLFDVEPPVDADLPVAAVTRALDVGVIDKGWWLRADPVHLRPERDRLVLVDTQVIALAQDEATRLAAEVAAAYTHDGWVLKAPRPGRWYLKPPRAAKILTTPLADVVGRDIHPYLPKGKDGKLWHTVLNEMQILLHTAAVNVEREQRGELPINSLWFWGSGRLPEIHPVDWVQVHSEEAISLSLARLADVPSRALPTHFNEWQRQSLPRGAHLVVLDQARTVVQYGDAEEWRGFIERLDNHWMAPMFQALKNRELAYVDLYSDGGRAFRLQANHARRWWRRRRPLASYR